MSLMTSETFKNIFYYMVISVSANGIASLVVEAVDAEIMT